MSITNIKPSSILYREITAMGQDHKETLQKSDMQTYADEVKEIQNETVSLLNIEYKKVEDKKVQMNNIFAENKKTDSKKQAVRAITTFKSNRKKFIVDSKKQSEVLKEDNVSKQNDIDGILKELDDLQQAQSEGVTEVTVEKPVEIVSAEILSEGNVKQKEKQLLLEGPKTEEQLLLEGPKTEEQLLLEGPKTDTSKALTVVPETGKELTVVEEVNTIPKKQTTAEIIAIDKRKTQLLEMVSRLEEEIKENNEKVLKLEKDAAEVSEASNSYNISKEDATKKLFNILEAKKTIEIFQEMGMDIDEDLLEKINKVQQNLENGVNEEDTNELYEDIENGMFSIIDKEYNKIANATYVDKLFFNNTVKLPYGKGRTMDSLSIINDKLEIQSDVLAKNSAQYQHKKDDTDLTIDFGKINKLEKLLDTTYAIGDDIKDEYNKLNESEKEAIKLPSMMTQGEISSLKYGIDMEEDLTKTLSLEDKYSDKMSIKKSQFYSNVQKYNKEQSVKKLIKFTPEVVQEMHLENLTNLSKTLPNQIAFYNQEAKLNNAASLKNTELQLELENEDLTDEEKLAIQTEIVALNTEYPNSEEQATLFENLEMNFTSKLEQILAELKELGVNVVQEETTTKEAEKTTDKENIAEDKPKTELETTTEPTPNLPAIVETKLNYLVDEETSKLVSLCTEHGLSEEMTANLIRAFSDSGIDKKEFLVKLEEFLKNGGNLQQSVSMLENSSYIDAVVIEDNIALPAPVKDETLLLEAPAEKEEVMALPAPVKDETLLLEAPAEKEEVIALPAPVKDETLLLEAPAEKEVKESKFVAPDNEDGSFRFTTMANAFEKFEEQKKKKGNGNTK
jgi:hypothetical protein